MQGRGRAGGGKSQTRRLVTVDIRRKWRNVKTGALQITASLHGSVKISGMPSLRGAQGETADDAFALRPAFSLPPLRLVSSLQDSSPQPWRSSSSPRSSPSSLASATGLGGWLVRDHLLDRLPVLGRHRVHHARHHSTHLGILHHPSANNGIRQELRAQSHQFIGWR